MLVYQRVIKAQDIRDFPASHVWLREAIWLSKLHSYKPIEAHEMTIKSQFSHHEILLNEITDKNPIKSLLNPHEIPMKSRL